MVVVILLAAVVEIVFLELQSVEVVMVVEGTEVTVVHVVSTSYKQNKNIIM